MRMNHGSWRVVRSEAKQVSFTAAAPGSCICKVAKSQDSCHVPRANFLQLETSWQLKCLRSSEDSFSSGRWLWTEVDRGTELL